MKRKEESRKKNGEEKVKKHQQHAEDLNIKVRVGQDSRAVLECLFHSLFVYSSSSLLTLSIYLSLSLSFAFSVCLFIIKDGCW